MENKIEKELLSKISNVINEISNKIESMEENTRIILPDYVEELSKNNNIDKNLAYNILNYQLKMYPKEFGQIFKGKSGGWYKSGKKIKTKKVNQEIKNQVLQELDEKLKKINDTV